MPMIDIALLSDSRFMRGFFAAFFFFLANLSFCFVTTVFMQQTLRIPPLQAGLVFVPLALTFVVASRHSGARAKRRGTLVLIEGCMVQIAPLSSVVLATGAAFFAIEASRSTQHALFAALVMFALSIVTCVAFLSWMRRA